MLKGISLNVEYEDGSGTSKGESWLWGNGCLKVAVYSGNSSCPKEDSSFVEKVSVDKSGNSITIYHKSNNNFKSHINFCWTQGKTSIITPLVYYSYCSLGSPLHFSNEIELFIKKENNQRIPTTLGENDMCKTVNIAHLKGIFIHGRERERERGYKVKCNYLPYLI